MWWTPWWSTTATAWSSPPLAESWEHNEDYTQWTFHIREGVKWVDKDGNEVADVTAQDWVDAAHYILDAANDSSSEYNFEVAQVTNAAAYYAYTAYLLELETATDGTDENGNPSSSTRTARSSRRCPRCPWRTSA